MNDEQQNILDWLKALAALGVVKYEWSPQTGLRVEFGPSATTVDGPTQSSSPVSSRRVVKRSGSIWEDANLWGGGSPPKFPTEE